MTDSQKLDISLDETKADNAYKRSLVSELKNYTRRPVALRRDAKRVNHLVRKLRKFGVVVDG